MAIKKVAIVCSISALLMACHHDDDKAEPVPVIVGSQPPANNSAPIASAVTVSSTSSTRKVGDVLTAEYSYRDADNDPEGESLIQWYRVYEKSDGVSYVKIDGATERSYQLTSKDAGQRITVKVTPIASSGSLTGAEVVAANSATELDAFSVNDPLLLDQWYLKNSGVTPDNWGNMYPKLSSGADLRVSGAWSQGATGEGVVVTVVDDGVDFEHEDLVNQEQLGDDGESLSYAFEEGREDVVVMDITEAVDGENGESPVPRERNDHGTSIAGVIAAEANNGVGVSGIAPKSSIVALRMAYGSARDRDIEGPDNNSATRILDAGVSLVSNHSYGPDDDGGLSTQSASSYELWELLSTGGGENSDLDDHLIVFASGNGRTEGDYAGLDESQQNPFVISVSGFSAGDTPVSYAEAGPAVLVAGATGDRGAIEGGYAAIATTGRAGESYNYTNDQEAPYLFDHSHRMNAEYDSEGYFVSANIPSPLENGYTAGFNGTSAAAPTVAGVAALMRSVNPELSWRDVRWIMAQTARKIDESAKVKDASLEGADVDLWSENGNQLFGQFSHHLGYGAVNAEAAVRRSRDPSYVLLPDMKECILSNRTSTEDGYAISFSDEVPEGCPVTIEFVQIQVESKQGADASKFNMHLKVDDQTGKVARLFSMSDCKRRLDDESDAVDCSLTDDTTWFTGTTAFMGDKLNAGLEKTVFNFSYPSVESSELESQPVPVNVIVYGF